MRRENKNVRIKVPAGATTSETVSVGLFAWASVQFPIAIDGLSFSVQISNGDLWAPVVDTLGVVQADPAIVGGSVIPISEHVFSSSAFRIVMSEIQLAERELIVELKT